jgi:hypothetical protein
MFLFQNANCSSGDKFYLAGSSIFTRKTRKNKKQNKLFCFHHHHRPLGPVWHVDLQVRKVRNLDFFLSLFAVDIV